MFLKFIKTKTRCSRRRRGGPGAGLLPAAVRRTVGRRRRAAYCQADRCAPVSLPPPVIDVERQ